MSKYKHKLGVIVGRFQHFHLGHKAIVDKALDECEKVLVFVGSAQEQGSRRNPFSYEQRRAIICDNYKEIDGKRVFVLGMQDLTHENDISFEWGKYVLDVIDSNCKFIGLQKVDAMYYGNDENRKGWFDPKDIEGITMYAIPRGSEVAISATELRNMIIENQFEQWKKYTDPKIHHHFNDLREQLNRNPYYDGRM